MAIIVQGCTVVVKNTAIQQRFPGGLDAYRRNCPNLTYYSDGTLSAVAFMTTQDAVQFARLLASYGFPDPLQGSSGEVAIAVDAEGGGFLGVCDWLRLQRGPIPNDRGHQVEILIALLKDEIPTTFTAPADWQSLARAQMHTPEELDRDYELIAEDPVSRGRLLTYRHRTTQQLIYIGRPAIAAHADEAKFTELRRELGELERMPISRERDARLASFYEECTRLVDASGGTEGVWLQLQGVAARLSGRWKAAEQAFRRLTELRPDFALGWMDLTGVLAHQDRLADAEVAAREAVRLDPANSHAHGNLANVLNRQGKIEPALQAVARALELEPANQAYRIMRQRLLRDVSEKVEESHTDSTATSAEAAGPWYKRLLRRGQERS